MKHFNIYCLLIEQSKQVYGYKEESWCQMKPQQTLMNVNPFIKIPQCLPCASHSGGTVPFVH